MTTELAILTHSQGKIKDVNAAFCDRFGYTREEIIGQDPLMLIPPDWQSIVNRKIRDGDEAPYYTLGRVKDGGSVPVYLQAKQLRGSSGQMERVVVIREARDLPTTGGSSASARDEDLTRLAHELRTPLTTMLMALQMIKLAPSTAKQEQYYQIALQSCEKELNLINSTLTLRRLASETYSRNLRILQLGPWLLNLVESLNTVADGQNLQMGVEIPEGQILVETDPNLLSRVLQELIGNALKYTQAPGQVLVRMISGESGVTFEVQNTATILPEALPRLFERFYRVERGDRHEQSSSGLGLYLVREILQFLEGEIQVESHDGLTRFVVWIPQCYSP